jgi:hypothetical protein
MTIVSKRDRVRYAGSWDSRFYRLTRCKITMGKRTHGEIAFRCFIHAKRAWPPLVELAGKRLVGSHPEAKCSLGAVASVSS